MRRLLLGWSLLAFALGGCAQPGPGDLAATGGRAIPDGFLAPFDAGHPTLAPDGGFDRGDFAAAPSDGGAASPCALALAGYRFDFESGDQGFTHQASDGFADDTSWPFDAWQEGAVTSGPGACHGGSGCWATNGYGNYIQCQRAELVSPALDLSACPDGARLVFYQYYDFWSGRYGGQSWADGGTVELSGDGGDSWTAASAQYSGTIAINPNQGSDYSCLHQYSFSVDGSPGFTGASGGWEQVVIPIPPALATAQLRIRFAYGSGVSYPTTKPSVSEAHEPAGWYLDDLSFEAP